MSFPRVTDVVARLRRRVPPWLRIVLDIAAVALGLVLVIRPTTALDVLAVLLGGGMVLTGVVQFADDESASEEPAPGGGASARTADRRSRWRLVLGVVWIAVGVFVLLWPGLTVRLAAGLVGGVLLFAGALGVIGAFARERTWDQRASDGAFGLSGVIFGIVAFSWPDITLLVVAVVFGAWLLMLGVSGLWRQWRAHRATQHPGRLPRTAGRARRWGRTIIAMGTIALAVTTAVVTTPLREGSTVVDEFYAAPRDIPDQPGVLVRAEPFTRDIPEGARAWRILYTTTGVRGEVRVASGLVVVPVRTELDGAKAWPVIDWNHGTTGYAQHCAPSLQERPLWSGAMYVTRRVIAERWAIVAPDYIGLGSEGSHPYLIGEPSAHASLDAVRAARQLEEAELSMATVIWGHSQGGGAALWAGALTPTYARGMWLRGVAALAPASDPLALVERVTNVTGGSIFASFAFEAYSKTYPDVSYRDYIRPGAETFLREMSQRCLSDPGTIVSVVAALSMGADLGVFATDPTTGALGRRLVENTAPLEIDAPLFIGQGGADSVVVTSTQTAFVNRMCAAGQQVDYRVYEGFEHAAVVEGYSPLIPDLFAWTRARFDGEPLPDDGCTRTDVPAR